MFEFFQHLLDPSDFPARWTCGQWSTPHGWLHILSDGAIWGAYTAIPIVLAYFTMKRRDLPFPRVFWLFFVFILFCGTGHLIEATIFWWPAYRLSGVVKFGTAIVSWATVFALIRVTPEALKLPGLARLNEELNVEIQERLRVEKSLREAEQRINSIMDSIPGLVALVDRDKRYVFANATYTEWFGIDPKSIIGKTIGDVIGETPWQRIRHYAEQVQAGQKVYFEDELTNPDGTTRPIAATYVPQYDASGEISGHLALVMDNSESQRAQERFRVAVEAAPNAMVMVNESGEIVLVNSQMEKIFGYAREELIGQSVDMLVPDQFKSIHPAKRQQFVAQPSARSMGAGRDLFGRRKSGSEFPVEIGLNPIQTSEGLMVLASIIDITERKQTDSLKESERRFRTLADTAPVMIWSTDEHMTRDYFNRPWLDFTGNRNDQEARGGWLDGIHPDDRARCEREYKRALNTQERFRLQYRLRRWDGEYRWIMETGAPKRSREKQYEGHIGSALDITDYHAAQGALQTASRLEATATLAGGIAHDVNNLMVGVLGSASLVRSELDPAHEAQEQLETIEVSAERASTLAQELLAFAHGGKYQPRRMDLNKAVREALDLKKAGLPSVALVERHFADDLWMINADSAQISQVVLNVVLNGVEEMRVSGREGAVRVYTSNEKLHDPINVPHFGTLQSGRYVKLTVSDEGNGIAPDDLPKIFEPFFTTRFQGRGLGLAAVYGIVQNHGGAIRVETEVGRGTTIEVWIPVVETDA